MLSSVLHGIDEAPKPYLSFGSKTVVYPRRTSLVLSGAWMKSFVMM